MKKILVPTDFSKPAFWALETAINIARKAKAEITILHVVEQPTKESFHVTGEVLSPEDLEDKMFTLKLIERNKAQLSHQASVVEKAGVPVRQELRMGNPFHGINKIIADHQVDLVVMGTTSRSRMEQLLVGSNTEKVIRSVACPVLTVHHGPSVVEFKNIVYATSMSDNEKKLSEVIRVVQDLFDSTVHFVRINTPLNFQSDTKVKILMEDFARSTRLKNFTVSSFNDFSEEEGIIHFAASVKADLISMATHGRTGFAQALVGSIAEDVATHARTPVLTFVTKEA
jgi:nucleotide-binding universal stress UspA family protein